MPSTETSTADQIVAILHEAASHKATDRGLRQVLKALKALGCSRADCLAVLEFMEYVNRDGVPYYAPFQAILDKNLPAAR